MSVPPYLLDMRFTSREGRLHRLWLPLFLLWPLLLVLAVLSFVLTLLADIALWAMGQRYHYYTLLLAGLFSLLAEVRGTHIYVNSPDTLVDITVL